VCETLGFKRFLWNAFRPFRVYPTEGYTQVTRLPIDWDKLNENRRANALIVGSTVTLLTIVSLVSIYLWLASSQVLALTAEVPGLDGAPERGASEAARIDLAGEFLTSDGVASELAGAWPSFRGPDRTNIVTDSPPLANDWGAEGPEVLWHIPVGEGYAAPAVLNGRVYLMDYDVEKRADAVRCLSLDDGREIWRRFYGNNIKRNHGMSRTIPAVTDRYLVGIGPKCHVVCLDSFSGDFLWGIDLQLDYGTEEPLWYAGQCPVIIDDVAIIAPAGDEVLMMGVACDTGDVLWTAPNPRGWVMSHSSIMPMTLLGRKMYVYMASGGICGVSAEPEDTGALLWDVPLVAKVVAPSPVQVADDLVFATTGYGEGSRLIRISESGGEYNAELVYDLPPDEILACEQQTPIFHDGHLYSIMPKDAGALKQQFVCYTPEGEMVWSSGQDNRFGLGPFLLADNKFFVLDDKGTLTMFDALSKEYVQLGQAPVLDGHDSWGPLALAGTRLLVRDMNFMACVELGADT
jgi:outer membrane protein assembly factor BamB